MIIKSMFAGCRDYKYASLSEIADEIREWRDISGKCTKVLLRCKTELNGKEYFNGKSQIESYCDRFIVVSKGLNEELHRIYGELFIRVDDAVFNSIRALVDDINANDSFAVEFKQSVPDSIYEYEDQREIFDDIYCEFRNLLGDISDLGNISSRLENFLGGKIGLDEKAEVFAILTALPLDQDAIDLEKEISIIKNSIGNLYKIEICTAVEIDNLATTLICIKPKYIHFIGHATSDSVILRNSSGDSVPVDNHIIAEIISQCGLNIKLFVGNCCDSSSLANRMAEFTNIAIGTTGSISDDGAKKFAKVFYESIKVGADISNAFNVAIATMKSTSPDDADKYSLYGIST